MKHCIECGAKLQDGLSFCTECGSKQPVADKPSSKVNQQAHQDPPPPVKRPAKKTMTKRTKVLIGIAAGICIALFGAHQFLSSYFDPMKQLHAMDNAASEQDMDEFISHISFDKSAALDKDSYFEYILEHEWDFAREDYLAILEEQKGNSPSLSEKIYSSNNNLLFTIKQIPALLGLYTTYSLKAEPAKLHLSATLDNTELKIGDFAQNLKKPDTTEVAKIYPGNYDVSGKAKNLFGEFAYEDTLKIGSSEEYNLDVNFGGREIDLSHTEYPDAALFLDGEDSGKKLGDFEYLGPFPEDSDMKVHAEWKNGDGKIMKSNSFTPSDLGMFSYGSLFSFDELETDENEKEDRDKDNDKDKEDGTDEEQETKVASSSPIDHDAAGDAVLDFRDAYEDAVNTKDFSLIAPHLETGSHADKELSKYIDELENKAYHHDFTSNEILDVEEVDDHTVKVKTNEQFTFTNHKDEQTEYDREKFYTLTVSGDSYKITKIDYVETNKEKQ